MTVPMAIVDYIPVALFIAAAVLLQRDLYNKMSKGAFALFAAGTLMIMTAGLFKATWKLLYAMNVCDFVALNEVFLPMQAVGFLLTGAALIALLTVRQGRGTAYAVAAAPLPYTSGMIFIVLMVLGIKLVEPFGTFTYDVGQMIGPAAMLVTGMIIGGMDLRQICLLYTSPSPRD